MTIPALGAVGSVNAVGLGPAAPIAPVTVPGLGVLEAGGTTPTSVGVLSDSAAGGSATGFAAQLAQSLQNLQNLQTRSDQLAVQAATGDLKDVHDYTLAATEASLATQLTVAVRDKALAAFSEIMRMQG